jgi:hypothetical protein
VRQTMTWLTRLDNRFLGPPKPRQPLREQLETRPYRFLVAGVILIVTAIVSWHIGDAGPIPFVGTAAGLLEIGLGIHGLIRRHRSGTS